LIIIATEIRVIDSNGLFDEINRFLDLKDVKAEDYRLIEADEYEIDLPRIEEVLVNKNEQFIVPETIAEQVVKVLFTEYRQQVQFMDKNGNILLESKGFALGNLNAITAFSFEDLNFHSDDIGDF
jgi:hypothetical protein